jgi:signal transduction histidine kinase/CheY-like chemotaxis protein
MLVHVLRYHLDQLALIALAAVGLWKTRVLLRRRGKTGALPNVALLAVVVLAAGGVSLAEWSGRAQRDQLVSLFSGFAPTYANELSRLHHRDVTLATPADNPVYLALIEREKTWLRLNPLIADIYTFREDADGKVRFIVDSETDYDRNGRIEGEREQRTQIGEAYEEDTTFFKEALAGRNVFDASVTADRWGVWVSSQCPIYDENGRVEAGLGIDYPADAWITAILRRRGMVLLTTAVLIGILLSSSALITLMQAEIAERRLAQQALECARQEADAANRAKGEFLAVMSHEIRTPLTAVTGYASMLEETTLDSRQQRYVRILHQGATNLSHLVNNILDFSKIEEGKLELETAPCDPTAIVESVMELLQLRAQEKSLALNFDNRLDQRRIILGDSARLQQILVNLVGNALKFTASGSVTVSASWTPSARKADAGDLVVSVSDTGPGIPADKIKHLFQMFVQVDKSTTRRFGGTGLGLAISRRLVELMGGRIEVESVVGKGSKFRFTVPVELAAVKKETDQPDAAEDSVPPSTGGCILIVDDNIVNRTLLDEILRNAGYSTEQAASGAVAVELTAHLEFTAILMDLEMPEIDGWAATRRIRAAEKTGRHTPIIAITALANTGVEAECRAAGMDAHLAKPVNRPQLLAMLAEFTKPVATM